VNKIYHVVWDDEKECFVVVSELAAGHQKSGSAKLTLAIAGALLVGGLSAPAMSAGVSALKSGLDTIASYYSVNDGGVQGGNYNNDGATGANALAAGVDASASGRSALAVGTDATASGDSSIAMGDGSVATGLMATGIGSGAQAIGDMSTAAGSTSSATGTGATSFGYGANAAGVRALASGYSASASGDNSTALGNSAKALAADGVAIGSKSLANTAAGIAGYVPAAATAAQAAAINATRSTLGAVSVGDAATNKFRQITGVAAGTADSDAVNVAQLKGATADAVLYDNSTHDSVTLGGPTYNPVTRTGGTKITNVANGVAPSDAVNKSQLDDLADTPLTFAGNTGTVQKKLGDTVSIQGKGTSAGTYTGDNLRTEVDANGVLQVQMTDKPVFTSVTTGNTTVDTNGLTIAGGPSITISGIDAGGSKITNLAAGEVSDTSTDAINGSQLKQVQDAANAGWNVTDANGNTAKVGPNGKVTFTGDNNVTVTQTGTDNNGQVEMTLNKNLDLGDTGSVTMGNTVVNNNGLTIAGGPSVTINGIDAGGKKITNVADGEDPADAVNVSQLNTTVEGAKTHYFSVNDGGTQGSNYNNDGATGTNAIAAGVGAKAAGASSVALGQNASASTGNSVALGTNSTTGAVKGTAGATIAGDNYTFAGSSPTGTVSVGAAGQERTITNVAAGVLSSDSTDAVNGSQLYATNQAVDKLDGRVSKVETTVNNIAGDISNISSGQAGMFQTSADQKTPAPTPTGKNSAAGGAGATASGENSLALGNGSQATASNSVAIGNNSVADRANAVSMGSTGNERQITNVAAGTQATDAVNVSQLKSAQAGGVQYDTNSDGSTNYNSVTLNPSGGNATIHNVQAGTATSDAVNVGQLNDAMGNTKNWAKSYTDQQVNQMGKRAYAGTASALASAGIPQAYQPNQSVAGVGIGTYRGQSAISVGVSTITESGRYIFKASATGSQQDGLGANIGAGVAW